MRTVLYLSKFDITWEFVPGKKNIIADLLSRVVERSTYRHDLPVLVEDDSHLAAIQLRRGKVLLEKPALKTRPAKKQSTTVVAAKQPSGESTETSHSASSSSIDDSAPLPLPPPPPPSGDKISAVSLSQFIPTIVEGYKTDVQFSKALTAGVESGIYALESNGLLYLAMPGAHRLCIPNAKVGEKGSNLRELLISHIHEMIAHKGSGPTSKLLQSQFYWKTMSSDVDKYVRSCHSCQTRKTSPTKQYGKNHPLPVPHSPWEIISMDFMVNLPSSALGDSKYNSLYVVVDTLSKMVHLIPTTTTVKAEGVARLYFEHIYRLHGLPKGIISDRDTKFTGAFWRALQKMVGTELMMSTTDHPQTDGQTERMNRTVLQSLRHFVNTNGSDWAQHLPTVEFAINSAVSRSTGKAPFEIVYGYLPRTFPPITFDQDNPASMDFVENRMLSQLSAQDSIIAAKTEQSYHVNKHRKGDPAIAIGDLVVVSNESQLSHLPKGRQKLALKWVGPYKVTKTDPLTSNYTLDITGSKRHNTFHVSALKPYVEPQLDIFPNRQRRQPRIAQAEQDLNLEVEKIIGHERRRNNAIHFLCKWEGYPNEDATYRPAEEFRTSPYGIQVVKDYLLGFGECPEELMAWATRTDWISESMVVEWNRRAEAGEAGKVKRAGKAVGRVGVNKEPAVSSVDKELAAEENGTGVLHLRLALEGNKDKGKGKKKLERLTQTSFKRGKDVGPAPYFSHISASEQQY